MKFFKRKDNITKEDIIDILDQFEKRLVHDLRKINYKSELEDFPKEEMLRAKEAKYITNNVIINNDKEEEVINKINKGIVENIKNEKYKYYYYIDDGTDINYIARYYMALHYRVKIGHLTITIEWN